MIHSRTHEYALGTKPPRRCTGHGGTHPKFPRLIAGGTHHSALGRGARRRSPDGRADRGCRAVPPKRKTRPYPNGKSHDASAREITTDAAKPKDPSHPFHCSPRRICRPSIVQQGSLPAFRINDDGDRAVVGQTDLHVRAKFAGLNAPAQILSQPADELLIKRNRHFRPG